MESAETIGSVLQLDIDRIRHGNKIDSMLNPATFRDETRDRSSLDLDAKLKQLEDELDSERRLSMAILDTVGALVIVLDPELRIVRFNTAC